MYFIPYNLCGRLPTTDERCINIGNNIEKNWWTKEIFIEVNFEQLNHEIMLSQLLAGVSCLFSFLAFVGKPNTENGAHLLPQEESQIGGGTHEICLLYVWHGYTFLPSEIGVLLSERRAGTLLSVH